MVRRVVDSLRDKVVPVRFGDPLPGHPRRPFDPVTGIPSGAPRRPAQSRLSRLARSCSEPGLGSEECPSVYACYRFATKLREHMQLLDACVARVLSGLRAVTPEMGPDVAVGGSGLPPMPTDKVRQQGGGERAVAADPD